MKTIIKTSLIAIALLIGVSVNAQDKPITFGVKAGVGISNFSGDFNNTKAKVGFNAGITLDYALTSDLYLLTGLDFATKGSKLDENSGLKMNLSYLQLPVHLGYKLAIMDNAKIVFRAGPYIGYAVDGKWNVKAGGVEGNVSAFGDEAKAEGLKMSRFDFGLGAGVGVEFGQIGVGIGCDFGLANISDFGKINVDGLDLDASNVKVRNMNAYLTLGYKF